MTRTRAAENYGAKYERLCAAKAAYDADNLSTRTPLRRSGGECDD